MAAPVSMIATLTGRSTNAFGRLSLGSCGDCWAVLLARGESCCPNSVACPIGDGSLSHIAFVLVCSLDIHSSELEILHVTVSYGSRSLICKDRIWLTLLQPLQ